jgi:cytochrome bd-type quinol oxidase subunit 1
VAICYGAYYKTNNPVYLQMFRFWRSIFAIGFALGIVSGIVLTFELGLSWGNYARAVGPILGPMICMEALMAFFLEAGFFGILVWGEGRVSKRVTMVSACMVALGALLSTAWILDANSWMQTPSGYREVNGQFQPVNWLHAIFNPVFNWRFPHMVLAVLVAAAWFIAAIGAYYLLRRRALPLARKTMSIALLASAILLPIQLNVGDNMASYMTLVYQPDKLIAAEGNFNNGNTGWVWFAVPDQAQQRNYVQLSIPYAESVFDFHNFSGDESAPGLKTVSEQLPRLGDHFHDYQRRAVTACLAPALILAVIFPASWVAGVLLALATPIIPVNMAVTGLGAEAVSQRQIHQVAQLSGQVLERLQAMSTLRALGAIGHQRRLVERAATELAQRTAAVLRVAFLASSALEWVSTFAIGLVAMYVGPRCSATSGSRCCRFTWGRRQACSSCSWPRLTSLRCGISPRPTTSARRRSLPRRSWRHSAALRPRAPSPVRRAGRQSRPRRRGTAPPRPRSTRPASYCRTPRSASQAAHRPPWPASASWSRREPCSALPAARERGSPLCYGWPGGGCGPAKAGCSSTGQPQPAILGPPERC